MPARDAAGMIMSKILMVVRDRPDHIPLIYLHMIDIIQQFEILRPDPFHQFDPPLGIVTHLVFVVDLAVQQFHMDDDPLLLRDSQHLLQPRYSSSTPSRHPSRRGYR